MVDRLAAGFVLLALVAGCLFLWIGIPALGLWALGQAVESRTTHFVAGVVGVPIAMALFAPLLVWMNALYLRINGALDPDQDEDEDYRPRLRGPLEPLLVASFVAAIVALVVWFFFFAEDPTPQVI